MQPDRQILETELLVVRCQRGDREAFAGIVRLWERSLFYYLRRLAGSEADAWDLLQETWLKVFRAVRSIRDPRTLPAFLYATARNVAVSRLRLKGLAEADGAALGDVPDDGDAIGASDDAERVHRALDRLPVAQREVLTLYFLRELSIDEIAAVAGVPVGTVKSRLHYAKRGLREALSEGDGHVEQE